MSNLYIPNSVALRNFESIFINNNFDFKEEDVDISFHPRYVAMHPVGLAFYAALGDYFVQENKKVSASINYEMSSIPYLQRMGLFSSLRFSDIRETKKHEETGRFIPLTKIRNSDELSSFVKTLDPILHTTRENSRSIKHVFSELLRNVIEHSDAQFGGNVCANYIRDKKKISIGISDAGKGLFQSLKVHHNINNYAEAIIKALTPGISGTTSKIGGTSENAGAGLFFTKCIAQSTRNHFVIYSGDSYYKLLTTPKSQSIVYKPNPLDDNSRLKSSLPFFHGTLIGIDIFISDDKAFNNLIEGIGDAYQLSVKQSKKDYYSRINFK